MAAASNSVRRARPLLGTFVEIEAAGSFQPDVLSAVEAAFEAVSTVHQLMSFHDPDSDVGRLNREAHVRPVPVHALTFEVLEAALEMNGRSNGIFDVAVAPGLQAAGILPKTGRDVSLTAEPGATDAIMLLEGNVVGFRDAGVRIDLGGIAKGFAVDRALSILRERGVVNAIVNAGGDLACFGEETRTVCIRHPRDPGRIVCQIQLVDAALATTARRFDPFHSTETATPAIIDPRATVAACANDGATVRAASCMIADALTKVVMIAGTGATELIEQYSASALLIGSDRGLQITPDWQHAVHLAA
ncbi:MAG: FAD:protein FMN transferase [Bradyrhizobium sp.]|nr:FAD:protein FMN transferase [Bradyrhizobium sp.]